MRDENYYEFDCDVEGPNGETLRAFASVCYFAPGPHAPRSVKWDASAYTVGSACVHKLTHDGERFSLPREQRRAIASQVEDKAQEDLWAKIDNAW